MFRVICKIRNLTDLLEKILITEIEKPICNLNLKLVGIGGESMISMDMIVMNLKKLL